jgi:hypothetical protein
MLWTGQGKRLRKGKENELAVRMLAYMVLFQRHALQSNYNQ